MRLTIVVENLEITPFELNGYVLYNLPWYTDSETTTHINASK